MAARHLWSLYNSSSALIAKIASEKQNLRKQWERECNGLTGPREGNLSEELNIKSPQGVPPIRGTSGISEDIALLF